MEAVNTNKNILVNTRQCCHEANLIMCVKYQQCFISHNYILMQNADYTTGMIFDLSEKLEQSESQLGRGGLIGTDSQDRKTEDKLTKATKDG